MKPADNLLFASIDIPVLDKKQAAKEILALDDSSSWWDEYRHTKMFPLMTKGGEQSKQGTDNRRQGEFYWVPYAPKIITDWFDNIVFPWLGMKSRVMALVTQPGVSNNEHIDCDRRELNTRQHKFRLVLQGRTDTLYWITDQGKIKVPQVDSPFIMDGGWPHGMTNATNEIKVTLALGAPWNGHDDYGSEVTLLQNRNDYTMPTDLEPYWNNKY
jgi:hypothetical protein